jgi:hypothetical protein
MMSDQINKLVQSLLEKDSLEQCTVDELEQFAGKHPHFGAAHLLLTKKLQSENPERYKKQLEKTFLYFNNPFWVEHILNNTGHAEIVSNQEVEKNDMQEAEIKTEAENELPALQDDAPEMNGNTQDEHNDFQQVETDTKATHSIQQASYLKIEPVKTEANLLFQPFYTVDYFASQGIKFREEDKPADKFGQQLKSFTEWLKTLKRLPESQVELSMSGRTDHKVESLAENSVKNRDIITESMAEVWEKQGNHGKAIDVYNKLSLLDPSKNAYFAAKIEALKKLN